MVCHAATSIGQLASRLDRIRVEDDPLGGADRADLGHRLDHARLVVRGHHRDENRPRRERRFDRLRAHAPVGSGRDTGNLEAFVFQKVHRVTHRVVLDRARHHVATLGRRARAAPITARLSDSVPPLVKTISPGVA